MIPREEVGRTVSDPTEIEEEIHALCEALIATEGRLGPSARSLNAFWSNGILSGQCSRQHRSSISFAFRFVPKGDRKPVPRIDAHHGEVEVNEFLLGENADGFRIDLVGQMMHRD